ncbi:MAG TPA: hypothetical protein VHH35_01040 [Pyrinomonadaceae bacterium]|nr:hypothetical protein [Pyrinomonadaceae bacterium]
MIRIRIKKLRIVSMRDQQVGGVARASRDLPREFVIALVLHTLGTLEFANFVVANAWTTRTSNGGYVTHAHVRIVTDKQV